MESLKSPSPEPRARVEPPRGGLDIRTEHLEGGIVRIRLSGELDVMTAPMLTDALERLGTPEHPVVVVDMSELRFMDRTGLAALAAMAAHPSDRPSLAVTGCHPHVRRVFELTGHEELLDDRGGPP